MIEEEALFVRPDMPDEQIRLNRVAIEEVLRRLYQPYTGIVKKGNSSPQKPPMRYEICVKNRDKFGRVGILTQDCERMIDVAGLGVGIVRPGQVKGTLLMAQSLEPSATTIITNPDTHAGEIDAKRADDTAR